MLKEMLSKLRASVMVMYPGYFGIEDYEPVREILESNYEIII